MLLKSKKFWFYNVCDQFELTDEMMASAKQHGKFYDDALSIFDLIGTGVHPSLKKFKNSSKHPNTLFFNNVFVDINTIKIIFHLSSKYNINTLKFSCNNFNLKNLEYLINSIINKEHCVNNFTYEWNDQIIIDDIQYSYKNIPNIEDEKLLELMEKTQELIASLVNSKLEILCLRGNFLGDKGALKIFNNLKINESPKLRVLNLFNNNLTDDCIQNLVDLILINKSLEEINLGKNNLTDISLELISNNYGSYKMSNEELEEHRKKEKERQDIIKQNLKLKASNKPELEVIYLDPIKEVDGVFYRIKNDSLKVLNFIHNNFTEKSFDSVIKILDLNLNSIVSIDGKIYKEEQRNILKEVNNEHDYGNRVFLLK